MWCLVCVGFVRYLRFLQSRFPKGPGEKFEDAGCAGDPGICKQASLQGLYSKYGVALPERFGGSWVPRTEHTTIGSQETREDNAKRGRKGRGTSLRPFAAPPAAPLACILHEGHVHFLGGSVSMHLPSQCYSDEHRQRHNRHQRHSNGSYQYHRIT